MATQFYSSVNISKLNSTFLCPSLSSSASVQRVKRRQMFHSPNEQTDGVSYKLNTEEGASAHHEQPR